LLSSRLVRSGVVGALVAATAWTASGLVAFVFGVSPFGPEGSLSWYLIESSDAVAEAGMMVLLLGLHARQAPHGWPGTAGFLLAFAGTASIFLATVIYVLAADGSLAIFDVLEPASRIGLLVGFPLLGVVTLRAKVLPRWSGPLLGIFPVVLVLVFILVEQYGAVRALFGPYWLAVGYALWLSQRVPRTQPS